MSPEAIGELLGMGLVAAACGIGAYFGFRDKRKKADRRDRMAEAFGPSPRGAKRPKKPFHPLAAAGIAVVLGGVYAGQFVLKDVRERREAREAVERAETYAAEALLAVGQVAQEQLDAGVSTEVIEARRDRLHGLVVQVEPALRGGDHERLQRICATLEYHAGEDERAARDAREEANPSFARALEREARELRALIERAGGR